MGIGEGLRGRDPHVSTSLLNAIEVIGGRNGKEITWKKKPGGRELSAVEFLKSRGRGARSLSGDVHLSKEERREQMPICTKFVDDMREQFGELSFIQAEENGLSITWGVKQDVTSYPAFK